jgi:hypothetical protein
MRDVAGEGRATVDEAIHALQEQYPSSKETALWRGGTEARWLTLAPATVPGEQELVFSRRAYKLGGLVFRVNLRATARSATPVEVSGVVRPGGMLIGNWCLVVAMLVTAPVFLLSRTPAVSLVFMAGAGFLGLVHVQTMIKLSGAMIAALSAAIDGHAGLVGPAHLIRKGQEPSATN